jgi:hypothetical protein
MAPAISLFRLNILEDGAFIQQHEECVMKAILFAVASIFVVTVSATPSLARPYYQTRAESSFGLQALSHHAYQGRRYTRAGYGAHATRHYASYGTRHHASYSTRHYRQHASYAHGTRSARGGLGGRPARWCGWWMRTQKGGGPEYNLAANWRHWGRPSGPRVGAVVVWSHHVGLITGRTASGEWIVKSGNDGGAVRERPRSVAGAVFRI